MRKIKIKKFPYIVDSKNKQLIVFNLKDFFIFRKNFIWTFINRGKKSYSMKVYSYILNNLKKAKKKSIYCFFCISKKCSSYSKFNAKKTKKESN